MTAQVCMYGTNYTYKIWDHNVRNLWKAWNANPIDGKKEEGEWTATVWYICIYILYFTQ